MTPLIQTFGEILLLTIAFQHLKYVSDWLTVLGEVQITGESKEIMVWKKCHSCVVIPSLVGDVHWRKMHIFYLLGYHSCIQLLYTNYWLIIILQAFRDSETLWCHNTTTTHWRFKSYPPGATFQLSGFGFWMLPKIFVCDHSDNSQPIRGEALGPLLRPVESFDYHVWLWDMNLNLHSKTSGLRVSQTTSCTNLVNGISICSWCVLSVSPSVFFSINPYPDIISLLKVHGKINGVNSVHYTLFNTYNCHSQQCEG